MSSYLQHILCCVLLLIKQTNFSRLADLNDKQMDAAIKAWSNNKDFSEVVATMLSRVEHVKRTTPLLANQIHMITDIPNPVSSNEEDSVLIPDE